MYYSKEKFLFPSGSVLWALPRATLNFIFGIEFCLWGHRDSGSDLVHTHVNLLVPGCSVELTPPAPSAGWAFPVKLLEAVALWISCLEAKVSILTFGTLLRLDALSLMPRSNGSWKPGFRPSGISSYLQSNLCFSLISVLPPHPWNSLTFSPLL